jgi:hypothetical protein
LWILLAAGLALAAPGALAAGSTANGPAAKGGLDCNGFSPLQTTFRHFFCTEIAANDTNGFEDNGHYVGHDEPDIGFYSGRPGTANNMTYTTILPVDPSAPPAPSFNGPTHEFQLTPAIWFGLVLCDNESYPEGTKVCRPDSNSNIQDPPRASHAGAAYMELQLYPPGLGPAISCDTGPQWCAALTIDSLQASFGALHGPGTPPGAKSNDNCTEPVNFAFLTHSGVPNGPPGPDVQTDASFTPTTDTLKMNPGDTLKVSMHDTPSGFYTEIDDVTTGESGTMTASTANGFRHILWDPVNFTCNGAPYAFHPMYDSALPPTANGQPLTWTTWSAHTDNVAYDVETGHFEPADAASDADALEDPPCVAGPFISGCLGSDSDFDGYPYHRDWPNGSPRFPTPNYFSSPRSPIDRATNRTSTYPLVRFETDLPRIEEANNGGPLACDHHTGAGCTNPPAGAAFYPWFHLLQPPGGASCAWGLTNDMPNQLNNFGGEQAAWGPLEVTNYGFDTRIHNYARKLPNPCP